MTRPIRRGYPFPKGLKSPTKRYYGMMRAVHSWAEVMDYGLRQSVMIRKVLAEILEESANAANRPTT